MRRIILIGVLLFLCQFIFSQNHIQYGFSTSIAQTTLRIPSGGITILSNGGSFQGNEKTGYKTSVMFGGFIYIPTRDTANVGIDMFYNSTSSEELSAITFKALNLCTYFDFDPFDINLFFNLGIGGGYVFDSTEVVGLNQDKYREFDFFAKIAFAYQFGDLGRIEIGTYPGITEVVEGYLIRSNRYLSLKFNLHTLLKKKS